jgi:hypothetical protein
VTLPLVLKDLSRSALLDEARLAKPAFLYEPLREVEVYRSVLVPAGVPGPTLYGASVDAQADRFWLFLERVPGRVLTEVGDFAHWRAAACWLARAHTRLAEDVPRWLRAAPLLRYDAEYYRLWPRRAQAILGTSAGPALGGVLGGYEAVVDRLTALPVTVIHGEFFPSNVLTEELATGVRNCPVDWETAAVGPAHLDLAALSAGSWPEAARVDLAREYLSAVLATGGAYPSSLDDLMTDLLFCRLHLAIQRLGWAHGWSPPEGHRHDWLGEALHLSEQLGL